mgnify:CR=1 FL=1
MSFKKDLLYICKYVDEWTEGVESVRLDRDGEICFYGGKYLDFYPEYKCPYYDHFIPDRVYSNTGYEYTKEEFLACKEYLSQQEENPSVAALQDVVSEKVLSRIKEIRKRYIEDYRREITPLLEVLQRRGVECDEFIEF